MYFFIDGYNLLFTWSEELPSLEKDREKLIRWLQRTFKRMHLKGTVVFDGTHRRDEESGKSYPNPLEVAFAPKGQSADEYIIEQMQRYKHHALITVVTNDRSLSRHIKSFGAKAISNASFLNWLIKREQKRKINQSISRKENPFQEQRLLKIFEERLKKDLEDS